MKRDAMDDTGEPRRLLDDPGKSLSGDLLRSATADAPSRGARRRAMIALGVGTGILGASVTAASTSAASTGATGILKWIGIGVVSGGLVVGGAQQAMHLAAPHIAMPAVKGQEQAALRATRPALAAMARPLARPASEPVADAPVAEAPVADEDPGAAPIPAARPWRPATTSFKGTSLKDEVAQLDRARDALAKGDAQGALDSLEQHDKQFGTALLGPEAMLLRIEALAQRGDRVGAAALANQFLAAYPQSAHSNRVRSILARSVSGQ